MSETHTRGGFVGDPAAALSVTGSSGCCGNPPSARDVLAAEQACCGTSADAASGSCCDPAAKAEAVASGAGCCG